jgi:hypothetical protein
MNEKIIYERFINLDVEFYPIIKYYLKMEEVERAYNFVKYQIKSIKIGRNVTDLFDEYGYRGYAIEL